MGNTTAVDTALTESWQLLHLLWPGAMVMLVLTRLILARVEPWAERRDAAGRLRHRTFTSDQHLRRVENARAEPSAPGRLTGYEPDQVLDVHYLPGPHMLGTPGPSGDQLARALHKTGQLERFATFWAVRMPGRTSAVRPTSTVSWQPAAASSCWTSRTSPGRCHLGP
ncbi:MAG: hypothetical protein L0G99_05080 [Propionibacteriales bacterium]|nr:hypothetical protein [Propionibacteriales bacterium]